MRKHVLAFLSIFGLAGSSTPASAQVVKGSQSANTKSESTVKASKSAQESGAGQGAATLTMRKAGGEQNAVQDEDKKHRNQTLESKTSTIKGEKNTAEANAAKNDASKKVLIGLSEPAKNEADAKMRKAGGEQQAESSAKAKKAT